MHAPAWDGPSGLRSVGLRGSRPYCPGLRHLPSARLVGLPHPRDVGFSEMEWASASMDETAPQGVEPRFSQALRLASQPLDHEAFSEYPNFGWVAPERQVTKGKSESEAHHGRTNHTRPFPKGL